LKGSADLIEKTNSSGVVLSDVRDNNTCRSLGHINRLDVDMKNEKGFIELQMLVTCLVVLLTMFFFIFGTCIGVWKESTAKYQWFTEAMDFAAQASNITGDTGEVTLNEYLAREYFTLAMDEFMDDYYLESFHAVNVGQSIPGGVAQSPGYVATITVPVFDGYVGMVGNQSVEVPMRYFAVTKSERVN